MVIVSRRAARVGTAARACFILRASRGGYGLCCRRPGGARACGAAARRAGETGGPDSHPALHAARCSRHVASRGRLLPFGRANNNALGETAARVSACFIIGSVALVSYRPLANTEPGRVVASRSTPSKTSLHGCWWTLVHGFHASTLPSLRRGASNLCREIEARGRLGSARTCSYHSAAFPRERFEDADAAVLQSSLHHKELQQI